MVAEQIKIDPLGFHKITRDGVLANGTLTIHQEIETLSKLSAMPYWPLVLDGLRWNSMDLAPILV